MVDTIDWKALDAGEIELTKKNYTSLVKKGSVNRDFFGAALYALEQAERQYLLPTRNRDAEIGYSKEQAITAACFARQDVATILVIQQSVLRRLQELRVISWCGIGLLAFIAYRLL